MRILRLTPHYYFEAEEWPRHFDPIGGMQNQITILSEWLAEQGINQDVLTTGMPKVDRVIQKENLKIHSVRRLTMPLKSKYTGTVLLDESWALGVIMWCFKKRANHPFDIIHVHTSGVAAPLYVALLVKKILKIPLVLTIHCTRNLTYEPMNRIDKLIHNFVKTLELKAVGIADKVIFLTKKTKENFSAILDDYVNKYVVIQDVISKHHTQFKPQIRKKLHFASYGFDVEDEDKIILFVGRIAHEKGWGMFVDICEQLNKKWKNTKYVIVGDGPQFEKMKKILRQKKLHESTLVTGFISAATVPFFLNYADVLVIPSIHEELGGVSIEGVQANIPIVASKVGGLAVTFSHGQTALLNDFDDTEAFFNNVNYLLRHPEEGRKLSENARRSLEHLYQPEYQLEKVLQIYSQLIYSKE